MRHDYRKKPDEARLAVFARTLKDMEEAIRKAIRSHRLTPEFREEDLRPGLSYMVEAVTTMREERKVNITNREKTLTAIGDTLDEALIRLNAAASMEKDTPIKRRDKRFWVECEQCYRECASLLRDANGKIGNTGKNDLVK